MPRQGRPFVVPADLSVRTALIYAGQPDPAIERAGYFDRLIPTEKLFVR